MTTASGEPTVSVDRARCSGHARCAVEQPEFFVLDEDGYCDIGDRVEVPAAIEESVRRGVCACPEDALSLTEPLPEA